jgi:hypothetical protein
MNATKRDRPAATLMIPAMRGIQLRQIADAKGDTVAGILEDYIRSEIAAGTIPDTTPGFDLIRLDGFLVISTPKFVSPRLIPAHALEIARALDLAADRADVGGKSLKLASEGCIFHIARVGAAGIAFARLDLAANTEGKVTITAGIAKDVARQIRAALT